MSFRIHPHTPNGGACMIQVKGIHRAKSLAHTELVAKQDEEEYYSEDEIEEKQPVPAQVAQSMVAPGPAVQPATSNGQLYNPGPQSVEESFKLRRKRKV